MGSIDRTGVVTGHNEQNSKSKRAVHFVRAWFMRHNCTSHEDFTLHMQYNWNWLVRATLEEP